MPTPNDLLYAFQQHNLSKFKELLEVLKVNPNKRVTINNDRTIFETILSTANSAEYIKLCLKNDADFHMVRYNYDRIKLFQRAVRPSLHIYRNIML